MKEYFVEWSTHNDLTVVGEDSGSAEGTCPRGDWLRFVSYEPEERRYGGPTTIGIAEDHFDLSSRTVLEVLSESVTWRPDNLLSIAFKLHVGFISVFGRQRIRPSLCFTETIRRSVFDSGPDESRRFSQCFAALESNLLPATRELFSVESHSCPTTDPDWFAAWQVGNSSLESKLYKAWKLGRITVAHNKQKSVDPNISKRFHQDTLGISGSLIHMTNNRLGLNPIEENYVIYLIEKSLSSILRS